MFFQNKLKAMEERKVVDTVSNSIIKLTDKEKEIIDLVAKLDYTNAYISMLLLKIEFLTKDANKVLVEINQTTMTDKVKQVHIATVNQMVERLIKLKTSLFQIEITLKLNNTIEKEVKRQELLAILKSVS
jgi:cob(I)alamin adenosyltransferase